MHIVHTATAEDWLGTGTAAPILSGFLPNFDVLKEFENQQILPNKRNIVIMAGLFV